VVDDPADGEPQAAVVDRLAHESFRRSFAEFDSHQLIEPRARTHLPLPQDLPAQTRFPALC
jgi:hypothetical protein